MKLYFRIVLIVKCSVGTSAFSHRFCLDKEPLEFFDDLFPKVLDIVRRQRFLHPYFNFHTFLQLWFYSEGILTVRDQMFLMLSGVFVCLSFSSLRTFLSVVLMDSRLFQSELTSIMLC